MDRDSTTSPAAATCADPVAWLAVVFPPVLPILGAALVLI
jgi:hypothetical protein